jgi:membrane-bound ClpP family serine protease
MNKNLGIELIVCGGVAVARIGVTGGKVFLVGEYWNAVSEVAVEKDQPGEGLTLKVNPKTN